MNWVIAPIVLPLLTALVCLFWGKPGSGRRWFVALSALAQLVVALGLAAHVFDEGTLVLPVGRWTAQFGIVLVADLLSAVMLGLSSLTALAVILFGHAETSPRIEHPLRQPLVQFLVMGINLSFLTGDLFNLFVAFEILLIASYALLTLEADDWNIKQSFPYLSINLVGSTLFICAAGLAYGIFGTLNFAEISQRALAMEGDARVTMLALLLLVVFGVKAGLFPLYYWLPNSYPTLAAPIGALYAGMLTKVGVYVLLRLFATIMPHSLTGLHALLAWLAGFTMVLAVMGAISKNYVRGILSYHILSQIGYMVLAIGFFTPLSIAACVLYIMHHIVVKASLFLVGGVAAALNRTDDLTKMGHLWKHFPWLGVLFLLQALSLAGVPPLSGFWGKYLIVAEGLKQGAYVLVGASILASVLTMFSMLKIWNGAFWAAPADVAIPKPTRRTRGMTWVVAGLAVVSLCIGLGVEFFTQVSLRAAESVLDQEAYARAVLGVLGKGTPP